MSRLVLCKILRLFVNTLTPDDKCSLLNRDTFTQLIQILVSQKEKIFSRIFSAFLKFTLNFQHFQKQDDPHSQCFFQIRDSAKSD